MHTKEENCCFADRRQTEGNEENKAFCCLRLDYPGAGLAELAPPIPKRFITFVLFISFRARFPPVGLRFAL